MQAVSQRVSPQRPVRRLTAGGWLALVVFGFLAVMGFLTAVVIVAGYVSLTRDLKPPQDLEKIQPAEESIIYDRTGKTELARFGDIHREVVTFDQLPKILIDATTAVEDKSFWTNSGFDPAAIVASGLDALRGNARGASTITQQLVRQRLLDQSLVQAGGRTYERKLKEIIQSIRLTQFYSGDEGKKKIIAAYLNQNFYGNNSYGVKAAAKSYFGIDDLSKLTLAQAAILAALPQSPTTYDLVRNAVEQDNGTLLVPNDAEIVHRRNMVLDLLASGRTPLSDGQYTAADFEAAKQEPVVVVPQTEPPWLAPHFVWAVRAELTDRLCAGEQTCPVIEQGGLRVTTTLDLKLQKIAEKWVQAAAIVPKAKDPKAAAKALGLTYDTWMQRLRDKDLNNGALVALDYQTGELVAYVGSADYYAKKPNPQFQPKFDVVGSGYRQPGSAFKPFNYLTGIDDHTLTAATMFMDVGTDFGNYHPTDADNLERGPVRVRNALQFSLNIPSVKAVAVNKVEHVFARAQDFGMRFQTTAPAAGLSLALGVQEVRPVDLVTAYGTLANQGRFIDHTTILLVKDRNGQDVLPPYDEKPAGTAVASPEAAAIVTDILAGNTNPQVNPFWGKFQIVDAGKRRPATLKTGTNNDAKDLNAYGFIAPPAAAGRAAGEHALAVGVWNGNSDNTVVSTPQKPIFSIDVSTFVWQGFMAEATKGWAINDFQLPTTLVTAEVDPWTGLRPAPGGPSVKELFIRGTEPQRSVGTAGGVCGEAVFSEAYESKFNSWLTADRDWLRRAQRGPGVVGGPDRTRTAYFYNNGFNPYGRSWGPVLNGAGCESPGPSPTCFPVPTPDASGIIPSFAIPTPQGSGPAALPCPAATPLQSPTPEVSPTPSEPLPSVPLPSVPLPSLPLPATPTPTPPPSGPASAPPAAASAPPAIASGAP